MKILNFGSLNIDYTYRVENIVKCGETISASNMSVNIGGKGLNQSIALSRAGAMVYHAGAVGSDGKMLVDYLKGNNVDISNIITSNVPSGNAIIQVDDEGNNCIIIFGGANRRIEENNIDNVLGKFEAGDVLLVQNEISNLRYIIEKAHDKGMVIVLNPSPVTNLDVPLDKINYFILNECEAEALFKESDIEKLVANMKGTYPEAVFVLTLGEKGAIYIDSNTTLRIEAKKVKAVDTTAAGDTFTGYFLATLFGGESPEKALKIATEAAAITVSRAGAAQTIPCIEELMNNGNG